MFQNHHIMFRNIWLCQKIIWKSVILLHFISKATQKWTFDLNLHTLVFKFQILCKWRIKQNHFVFKVCLPFISISWCISSCKGCMFGNMVCMFRNFSVKLYYFEIYDVCFETYFIILSLTVITSQKLYLLIYIYISSLKMRSISYKHT